MVYLSEHKRGSEIKVVRMNKIKDVDCDGCKYLKYESDTDAYICTSKSGCDKVK